MAQSEALSPEEKAFGDAIADRIKHAIVTAASKPTRSRFARNGYASIAQSYIKSLPAKARAEMSGNAKRLMAAPLAIRKKSFGSFAAAKATVHRGALAPLPARVVANADRKIHAKLIARVAPPKTITKLPNPFTKVGFFLNSVKCVEETDEIGADQIMMAAILVSPDGEMKRTGTIGIHGDFDQGERKSYYPVGHKNFVPNDPYKGKHLLSFGLTPSTFPASYTLVLLMAEADRGGFGDMVNELWTSIADEVRLALLASVGHILGPFGPAIAHLCGYILDGIVAFLKSLFANPDDLIGRSQGTLTLASANDSYFDQLSGKQIAAPSNVWASNVQTIKFRGDGGYYKVKMHWRVWR